MIEVQQIESKVLRNALITGMINCFLASLFDKDFIPVNQYSNYLFIQATLFIVSTVILFYRYQEFKQIHTVMMLNSYLLYASICQFFIPASYMTFIIVLFVIGVFSYIPRKYFISIALFYGILQCLSIAYSDAAYSHNPDEILKYKMDAIQTVIFITVLILIAHSYRMKEHEKSAFIKNKLFTLGTQASNVIHDLKGFLFPPINHIEYLKENSSEHKEVIEELHENLTYIKNYILQANQMFSLNKKEASNINLEEIINLIKFLYSSKIKNINISFSGQKTIFAEASTLKTVLFNLILNSTEALNSHKELLDKKIELSFDGENLIVKDNGGGFSKNALENIKESTTFSEKKEGTGVGIFVIKTFVKSMNAKIVFYNENNGAVAKITFPLKNNENILKTKEQKEEKNVA